MNAKKQKRYRHTIIKNELGLHARSAAQIADIAQDSIANVWIQKGDEKADAASILDILTLACAKEAQITIVIEDLADLPILDAITDLVDRGFGKDNLPGQGGCSEVKIYPPMEDSDLSGAQNEN